MSNDPKASTNRFSDRVANYTLYRPSYPATALDWLLEKAALNASSCIADIGSGTGKFTELLVNRGLRVIGVEPNAPMRAESDLRLSKNPNYSSVGGGAEATLLDVKSVDLIVAAQAFHWFDLEKAKIEFKRIAKPGAGLALIWNRRDSATEFHKAYEQVLSQLPEYSKVKHTRITPESVEAFYGGAVELAGFPYQQKFDLTSFKGRVFSSSYTPNVDESHYAQFNADIESLYAQYAEEEGVVFNYMTEVFFGRIV